MPKRYRNKKPFEPDYRRKGWNQIKGESRRAFARSRILGAFLGGVIVIGCSLFSAQLNSPPLLCLGILLLFISLFAFPYFTRRNLNKVVEQLDSDVQTAPSENVDTPLPEKISSIAYKLSPRDFEREVAWVFGRLFKCQAELLNPEVVGGASDGGIDVKLYDKTGMLIAIIQAKRYDPKKTLNPTYLRDLDSCRRRMGVRRAFLVTTARFSESTQQRAKEMKIDLVDGMKFEQWRRMARGQQDNQVVDELQSEMLAQTPPIQDSFPQRLQPGVPISIEKQLQERRDRLNGHLS